MRTRIALVAIIAIALITVSTLTQAAAAPSARATPAPPAPTTPVVMPSSSLAAYHGPRPLSPVLTGTSLLLHLNPTLFNEALLHEALLRGNAKGVSPAAAPSKAAGLPFTATASPPAPAAAGTPAGPVDTVTPAQRAAWERVAMCEEGGNWSADSGSFSGGLGITRANWIAYGGGAFAPEGAMATEDQQIMVAERIQPSAPDQYGCHGW